MPLVFVYGTLKRGGSNHRQLAGQTFVAEAHTAPGYRMFNLGDYPGMVPWPEDRDGVLGEIWSVDEATLRKLDQFEGVDQGLYRRALVPLLPPYTDLRVEAYLYSQPVEGRPALGPNWPV
jgi:gamma-glutamylaminecyclotransferase